MRRYVSTRHEETSWLGRIALCLILFGVGLAGYSGTYLISQQLAYHSYKVNKLSIEIKKKSKEENVFQTSIAQLRHSTRLKTFTSQVHYPTVPKLGELEGKLEIPKLHVELPIIEGANPEQLAKGVGHVQTSVLPGQNDNCVLSGHRDTVFREIHKLKVGDQLIVNSQAGTFVYRITKMRIVDQTDRTVIVSTQLPTLTLTTCYPFSFIGNAPKRYIITAHLQPAKSQVASS